jgi:hypothetical protein
MNKNIEEMINTYKQMLIDTDKELDNVMKTKCLWNINRLMADKLRFYTIIKGLTNNLNSKELTS